MAKAGTYTNDASITATDKLFGTDVAGSNKNYLLSDLTTYLGGQIAVDQGEMATAVYDPAAIEEQLVGLVATQTLTNKTLDFTSATGTNTISLDSSDVAYDNTISGMTSATAKLAIDELKALNTAVKNISGWGYYKDSEGAEPTQSLSTTPVKLLIDGAHANSESEYLPLEIRGSAELWDVDTSDIKPINVGDSYLARVDFTVDSESGAPNEIVIQLDIGASATPTTVVVDKYETTGKSAPYNVSVTLPMFALDTFITNGGQIFLSTDTGTAEISSRAIFITRISSGSIS